MEFLGPRMARGGRMLGSETLEARESWAGARIWEGGRGREAEEGQLWEIERR